MPSDTTESFINIFVRYLKFCINSTIYFSLRAKRVGKPFQQVAADYHPQERQSHTMSLLEHKSIIIKC